MAGDMGAIMQMSRRWIIGPTSLDQRTAGTAKGFIWP